MPSSLQVILPECFRECASLEDVVMPADSKLVSIGAWAFAGCSSVRVLAIPSSLDWIDTGCFQACFSLSHLTFSAPSHIRKLLSLPPVCGSPIEIPDSIEILHTANLGELMIYTLLFGPDSELTTFNPIFTARPRFYRSFAHFSSRTLKRLRSTLEFA
jgi:hypothetical protein